MAMAAALEGRSAPATATTVAVPSAATAAAVTLRWASTAAAVTLRRAPVTAVAVATRLCRQRACNRQSDNARG
jgi:hypothetical protein